MRSEVIITSERIDEAALAASRVVPPEAGAVMYFLGFVRGSEAGAAIAALEYESFERMARHQFDLILADVAQRWPIISVRLVHRLGAVAVGEPSLWVEVVSPHRGEAFAAGQFIIDEMKKLVPIWKKPVPHRAAS